MNKEQSDYEKLKSEFWEQVTNVPKEWFDKMFYRVYTLGKQEKDAKQISSLEEEIHTYAKMCSVTEEDYTAIKKAVEHGVFLGKQEEDVDTVIQGWVARDEDGHIYIYKNKPERERFYGKSSEWISGNVMIELNVTSFPDLTWESDPEPVEIIIKRKRNG